MESPLLDKETALPKTDSFLLQDQGMGTDLSLTKTRPPLLKTKPPLQDTECTQLETNPPLLEPETAALKKKVWFQGISTYVKVGTRGGSKGSETMGLQDYISH